MAQAGPFLARYQQVCCPSSFSNHFSMVSFTGIPRFPEILFHPLSHQQVGQHPLKKLQKHPEARLRAARCTTPPFGPPCTIMKPGYYRPQNEIAHRGGLWFTGSTAVSQPNAAFACDCAGNAQRFQQFTTQKCSSPSVHCGTP